MSLAQPRILVADDQPDVVEALRLLLKANGFAVVPTSSPAGVLGAVETEDVDVVLMDLNYTRDTTSGREGLELLGRLQQLDPQLPVVVMTAWGSVEGAVDAIRGGARDYVTKPWDNTRLVTTLRSQVELGDALRCTRRLSAENERLQTRVPGMV
ncbi:MAG: response regulator, partial [Myxococcaceae bacterium]